MKTRLSFGLLALVAGCGTLVPSEKKASESVKSTEAIATAQNQTIKRTMEVVPEMAKQITSRTVYRTLPDTKTSSSGDASVPPAQGWIETDSPPTIRERLEIKTETSTDAGTKAQAQGSTENSIPLGVKIGLLGVGILILTFALIWAWRYVKTTGFGAAISLADDALAAQIRGLRTKAISTTDAKEQATTLAHLAELEATRGRLANS
jgi:hypothetical protein